MRIGSRIEVAYFVQDGVDYSNKKGQAVTRERGHKWGVRIDGREGKLLIIPENQLHEIPWGKSE